jgi:hypothetical protein
MERLGARIHHLYRTPTPEGHTIDLLVLLLFDPRFWWSLILFALVGIIVFGLIAATYGSIKRHQARKHTPPKDRT